MARKKTLRTNLHPYHITTRSNLKTWFSLPLSEIWILAKTCFSKALQKYPANIHAFVLMDNHYHLVIETPHEDIDKFMYEFNKNFSLGLREKSGHINKMFGSRYRWSLITNRQHYFQVMKYVFRNPVKAKKVSLCESYLYSSLKANVFEIKTGPYIDIRNSGFIRWINHSHTEEQNESIKKGLVKTNFDYSGSREVRCAPGFEKVDWSSGT